MGHPGDFERPAFRAALDSVHQISQKHDIPLGLHLVEPDPAALRASIARGYTLIAYSVDFRMIDVTCRAGMAVLDD
jgi:2-dehydro-3-deoxyglucarate aldolase